MDIVVDTSALLAVIVNETERDAIVSATSGHTLVGPGSIPWEIGNAFSAMMKRRRIQAVDAQRGVEIFHSIPIRFVDIDLVRALSLAAALNIYAYDAYFLDCAAQCGAPLLTLDRLLRRAADSLGLRLVQLEA